MAVCILRCRVSKRFWVRNSLIEIPYRTALGMGNPIGQVVGALAAGYPMEWYGRKRVCNGEIF